MGRWCASRSNAWRSSFAIMELRAPAESCAGHALSDPATVLRWPCDELDMAAPDFEQRFAALLGAKRERRRTSTPPSPPSSTTCARAATRRWSTTPGGSTGSTSPPPGSRSARWRSTRRWPIATPKALKALELAHARVTAYHERQKPADYASPTRSGSSSAGAGGRSTRSGSMCPAARRAIRRRS